MASHMNESRLISLSSSFSLRMEEASPNSSTMGEAQILFLGTTPYTLNPPYVEPYDFENHDIRPVLAWMQDHWDISVYLSMAYLILVYFGTKWMEKRNAFNLRKPLIVWNIGLCLFSGFLFQRILPEVLDVITKHGLYHAFCKKEGHTMMSAFYCLIFAWSKIIEFGDTAFIVLRKQRLILLHWYHHVTVAMYTFYTCGDFDPAGRYFGLMNSFIHFVMYAYYAARAMKLKVPSIVPRVITSLQILQMVVGLLVGFVSEVGKGYWQDCDRRWGYIVFGVIMYLSYFVLFLRFFLKAYGKRKNNVVSDPIRPVTTSSSDREEKKTN